MCTNIEYETINSRGESFECPNCEHELKLSPYRDGFWIVECATCGFDDKDDKSTLVGRYLTIDLSKIPLGAWDLEGNWYHNELLDMSKEEQRQHNIKAGYLKANETCYIDELKAALAKAIKAADCWYDEYRGTGELAPTLENERKLIEDHQYVQQRQETQGQT